jgi:hypothetical protein
VTLKGYAQTFTTGDMFHAYELTIGSKSYEVGKKWEKAAT